MIRNVGEGFGFLLRGSKPTIIDSVDEGSPGYRAKVYPNDVILSINGVRVETATHAELVELFERSGVNTTLEVIQKSEYKPSVPECQPTTNSQVKNNEGKTFKAKVNFQNSLIQHFLWNILFCSLMRF